MKTKRRVAAASQVDEATLNPETMVYSSDLLTPDEERSLLADFWEVKNELIRSLIKSYPKLRSQRPPLEPWPMAQFIRDACT